MNSIFMAASAPVKPEPDRFAKMELSANAVDERLANPAEPRSIVPAVCQFVALVESVFRLRRLFPESSMIVPVCVVDALP